MIMSNANVKLAKKDGPPSTGGGGEGNTGGTGNNGSGQTKP
jgi:hypothetical protein